MAGCSKYNENFKKKGKLSTQVMTGCGIAILDSMVGKSEEIIFRQSPE